jgi:hypothetical protein
LALRLRSGLAVSSAIIIGLIVTSGPAARPSAQSAVTFSEHVAPIVFTNCAPCHRPGEAAPFPLLSYRDVRPLAKAIASATAAHVMPPWKAGPSDYPFDNARRLTDDQIATIQKWVAAGAPEGDPSKTPALPHFTEGWQLGAPDLAVTMSEAYEVPATGPDIYRNFVVPLDLDHDTWVRAIDFRPSARTVVHHSLFFLDTTGAAREQDARDATPGFPGGMGGGRVVGTERGIAAILTNSSPQAQAEGVARAGGIGGWALGGRALELPEGLAFFVPKGSDLILSTHFHPSGKVEHEKSSVGLYFAPGPPVQAFTTIQLPPVFGVFEGLDIPAGQERYTITDSFEIPVDVRAFAVGAHAHYLGKEFTLKATLPDGTVKRLLSIGDWDFSWQERYRFKEFVSLPKGTKLESTVSYDNSVANKRNPSRPPVRVQWGEESTDEMGSIGLQVVAANRADLPQLQQAIATHIRERAFSGPGLKQLLQRRAGRGQRP